MNINFEKETSKFLFLLLIADLSFMAVHVLYLFEVVSNWLFSIEKDFGYAEVYQYIKEFWIASLLFWVAIRRNQIIYLAWSLLFMYLLLDDSLQIHEKLGRYLVDYFGLIPMFNLRAQDFGELSVSLFFGFVLFSFIGVSYLFCDHIAKKISKDLFVLVMSVAFFGVFVDMLHIAIPWGKGVFGLIEDGGEMLIMSVIVGYAFNLKTDYENIK